MKQKLVTPQTKWPLTGREAHTLLSTTVGNWRRPTMLLLLALVGCQAKLAAPTDTSVQDSAPPRPVLAKVPLPDMLQGDAMIRAQTPLEQIQPSPRLEGVEPQAASSPPPASAVQRYLSALMMMEQSTPEPAAAVLQLEAALREDPDSSEVHRLLGEILLRNGNPDRAMLHLERAAKLDPGNVGAHFLLGEFYSKGRKWDKAIEQFRLALMGGNRNSDDAIRTAAYYFLAQSLESDGYVEAAVLQYQSFITQAEAAADKPMPRGVRASRRLRTYYWLLADLPKVYLRLGRAQRKLGNADAAFDAFELARSLKSDQIAPVTELVRLYSDLQMYDNSLQMAQDWFLKHPDQHEALEQLGWAYQQAGKRESLLSDLKKLYNKHPENEALVIAYARAMEQAGRLDESAAALRQTIDSKQNATGPEKGELSFAYWQLARIHALQKDQFSAARVLAEAINAQPERYRLANTLFLDIVRHGEQNEQLLAQLTDAADAAPQDMGINYFAGLMARIVAKFDQSEHYFRNVVRIEPTYPSGYLALAQLQLSKKMYDAAFTIVQEALSAGIKSAELYRIAGAVHYQQGDLVEALRNLRQALGVDSQDLDSRLMLAEIYRKRGNVEQALAEVNNVLDIQPTNERAYLTLYQIQFEDARDIAAAKEALQRLLVVRPESRRGRKQLVRFAVAEGDPATALKLLESLIEDDGKDLESRVMLAQLLADQDDLDGAVAQMEHAIEQAPDNRELKLSFARIRFRQNNLDAAEMLYQQLLVDGPDDTLVHLELTSVQIEAHKFDRAILRLGRAVERLDAQDSKQLDRKLALLYLLSGVYQQSGDHKKTANTLSTVLRLNPQDPRANNDLGYTWADAGINLPEAEEMIRTAVDADPKSGPYLDSLGWVLYKQGKFDGALKYLLKASTQLQGDDAVIFDHLGDAYWRLGQVEDAGKAWRRGLKLVESKIEPLAAHDQTVRDALQQKINRLDEQHEPPVAPLGEGVALPQPPPEESPAPENQMPNPASPGTVKAAEEEVGQIIEPPAPAEQVQLEPAIDVPTPKTLD